MRSAMRWLDRHPTLFTVGLSMTVLAMIALTVLAIVRR
jgi:hypothetical protein